MGKGSNRRPPQISREEEQLRWKYAYTDMTFAEFERRFKRLKKEGKIVRSGRVIKDA